MRMLVNLLLIGAACYGLSVFLDGTMDYGHMFGKVRFNLLYKSASTKDKRALLLAKKETDFAERLQMIDNIYWNIATYKPYLILFLCRKCVATWIAIIAGLLMGMTWDVLFVVSGVYLASIFDK
jgi:hypothetical protein